MGDVLGSWVDEVERKRTERSRDRGSRTVGGNFDVIIENEEVVCASIERARRVC